MVNNIILEKICLFCITYKILEKICVFCINVPIIHPKVVRVLCPSRLLLSTITILVLMSRKNGVYSAHGNFALAPPFTIASYMSLIIRPGNSITLQTIMTMELQRVVHPIPHYSELKPSLAMSKQR